MSVAPPEVFTATITGRTWLDSETFILTCTRPADFFFMAGQHVGLAKVGEERDYTLVSSPEDSELCFLIKRVPGGRLSGVLAKLEMGSPLSIGKPRGYLVYRPSDRPPVFVATGVGVAPFVAMTTVGITGFTLIHGARSVPGLFFRQALSHAAARYLCCLTGTPVSGAVLPDAYQGRVTNYVERQFAPGAYDFYLCGSREMIHDMTHLLDRRFPDARVYSEAYM